MNTCPSCGSPVALGAKFCTSCGAVLGAAPPGATTPAAGYQAGSHNQPPGVNYPGQPGYGQAPYGQMGSLPPSNAGIYFAEMGQALAGIFARPVSMMKAVAQMQPATFGILAAILIIMAGLLTLGDSKFYPNYGLTVEAGSKAGKAFAFGILEEALVIGLLFSGLLAGAKMLGQSLSKPASFFNIAVIAQVPAMAGMILAYIFSYMNVTLAYTIDQVFGIISIIAVYIGMLSTMPGHEEKAPYGVAMAYLIVGLLLWGLKELVAK